MSIQDRMARLLGETKAGTAKNRSVEEVQDLIAAALKQHVSSYKGIECSVFGKQIGGYGVGDPFEPPEYEESEEEVSFDVYEPVVEDDETDNRFVIKVYFQAGKGGYVTRSIPAPSPIVINRRFLDVDPYDEAFAEAREEFIDRTLVPIVSKAVPGLKIELEDTSNDRRGTLLYFSASY